MASLFSQDQIENLKNWKSALQTEIALHWKSEEDKAEVEVDALLKNRNFEGDGKLSADDFDLLFRLMKRFSANRNLSKLLYVQNGLDEFNLALKKLYYGADPLPDRVEGFFKLKGIGTQTLSQFLVALDSTKYPLITSQTRDGIGLDAEQEQAAMELAKATFAISDMDKYLERTQGYLRDYVVFNQVRELVGLEKFTSVNNMIWLALKKDSESDEEPLEDFTSVSLEKDLRDYLEKNPSAIETGLKLVQKEFDTNEIGKIDLLLQDKKGHDVVVELKKGKKNDEVVGQISRYMGWVMKNRNQKVRGIVIVNEPDDRLKYALLPFKGSIKLKYYRVKFEISDNYLGEVAAES